jgi:hypothetical protein
MMEIRAHSHQQALRDAHNALDRGHPASYPDDEFAKLFNPASKDGPLAPDDEDDADNPTGPGGHQQIRRPPTVSDQQKRRASAHEPYTDAELFRGLFGREPKPGELEDDY